MKFVGRLTLSLLIVVSFLLSWLAVGMAVVPIFDFMLAGTSPRVSGALERQLPVGLYIAGTAALAAAIGAFIVARQLRVRGLLAGIYGILAVGFSMLAAFYAVFSLVIVFTFGSVRLR